MQSANSQLKKSAGIARNVPFVFGDITVYLQVHVIDQPAYKVLLGRPFDILTRSQVTNKADGGQDLLLHDPNTGKRCVVPTKAKGAYSVSERPKPTVGSSEASTPANAGPAKQADFLENRAKATPASQRATVESVPDEDDVNYTEDEYSSEESDFSDEGESPDFR
jgi:hypothetical protein